LNCLVCHEEADQAEARYCLAHARAYQNLKQSFTAWEAGYGTLTVPDFLKHIQKLPGTGEKTREIARFLIENPLRWT
jgi:hypothetical protein